MRLSVGVSRHDAAGDSVVASGRFRSVMIGRRPWASVGDGVVAQWAAQYRL